MGVYDMGTTGVLRRLAAEGTQNGLKDYLAGVKNVLDEDFGIDIEHSFLKIHSPIHDYYSKRGNE